MTHLPRAPPAGCSLGDLKNEPYRRSGSSGGFADKDASFGGLHRGSVSLCAGDVEVVFEAYGADEEQTAEGMRKNKNVDDVKIWILGERIQTMILSFTNSMCLTVQRDFSSGKEGDVAAEVVLASRGVSDVYVSPPDSGDPQASPSSSGGIWSVFNGGENKKARINTAWLDPESNGSLSKCDPEKHEWSGEAVRVECALCAVNFWSSTAWKKASTR
ncbi:hypothetical protein B0H13DRAFT_1936430 [Mycena leptocephala]|nr:hypothetical protein B0H13DRAFT_1936430 [Mycena leptocephala]